MDLCVDLNSLEYAHLGVLALVGEGLDDSYAHLRSDKENITFGTEKHGS